jgi:DNA primase
MTVVDDIKSRQDILEVVSRYLALQRSGSSYKASCPFHQEKTPSFYVFPDRQSWRCFGACATGGDMFSFVMRAENIDFPQALKRLAEQAGVRLSKQGRRPDQGITFQINEQARTYFQDLLASSQGAAAAAYLARRGLAPETIEKFELGLSPSDGESLKNRLVKQGFSLEHLTLSGVVRRDQNGRFRDFFRGRVMIPIRDARGQLGGFGGRALDSSPAKYLNSPRSPNFDKGRILFALNLSQEAARQRGIVVVEGYMDAIMAHQHGFDNVVAIMGTALTEQQVAQVRRITGKITMALDPDVAGQQATLRSLESSWRVFQSQVSGRAQGITLYKREEMPDLLIAVLPEGMDPDQVIRRSPKEWANLVESGMPLLEYLFVALSTQVDVSTPQGKARLAELLFPLIAGVPDPSRQDHYFQELAVRLGVSPQTLQASVGRPSNDQRRRDPVRPVQIASESAFAKLDRDPIEDYCLALLLQNLELWERASELHPEYFRRVENREIFSRWLEISGQNRETALEALSVSIDTDLTEHLDALVLRKLPPQEPIARAMAFQDTVRRLEGRYLRDLKSEEELRFTEAPPDSIAEDHKQVLSVNERIRRNQVIRKTLTEDSSNSTLR